MAQIVSSLVGHQDQWEQVRKIISSDLQSGSFLFTGPEGIGKKKMALALVQYFLCETRSGCGHCGSCRRVEAGTHEGLLIIDHDDDILKIEEAGKVKDFIKLKSLTHVRFIIINNAHLLNIPTSNALLKTLEEPPQGVYFILISSRLRGLLTTIKSRCRLIPFSILNENELRTVSQQIEFSVSNFSQSGQMHLISKSQDKDFKAVVGVACAILDSVGEKRFEILSDVQKSTIKSKDLFLDLITYLEIFIRDILLTQSTGIGPGSHEDIGHGPGCEYYFEDYVAEIQKWAATESAVWCEFFEQLRNKKEDLFLSPDSALFVESLIIENNRSVM